MSDNRDDRDSGSYKQLKAAADGAITACNSFTQQVDELKGNPVALALFLVDVEIRARELLKVMRDTDSEIDHFIEMAAKAHPGTIIVRRDD